MNPAPARNIRADRDKRRARFLRCHPPNRRSKPPEHIVTLDRRNFLRLMGAAAATSATATLPGLAGGTPSPDGVFEAPGPQAANRSATETRARDERIAATARGRLPVRNLGRTGAKVGILGFGAGMISEAESPKAAVELIHGMIDRGVNYLDTAPSYSAGISETRVGEVMKTRRDDVFLATKILKRSYDEAKAEFDGSLKRLNTGHVDLLQIHAVNRPDDLDPVFARDGSLRLAVEALRAGKTRFVGISGHTFPEVLCQALDRYPFSTVLIPLGLADVHLLSFAETVIPKARAAGAGVVAMKVLGMGRYAKQLGVERCLRYSLNLDVDTAIVGMKNAAELDQAHAAASRPAPLTDDELLRARDLAMPFGTPETLWWKKSLA